VIYSRLMTERHRREERSVGCGCSSTIAVLTVGLGLALLNAGASIGVTVGIPLTDANITLAGCIGQKDKAIEALPDYVEERVGDNQNFINSSHSLTIGPVEGCGIFVIGKQEGAPAIGLHINIK